MLAFDIRLRYADGSVKLRGDANGFGGMDPRDVMEELAQWDELTEGRLLDLGGEDAAWSEDMEGCVLDFREDVDGAEFLTEMDIM
jgi:hypothetical protein